MYNVNLLSKYFPGLDKDQLKKFTALASLYQFWNEKINVISRKDIDQLYLRHVLHSLSIAKFIHFQPKCRILDVGTGGGFPGLPLAILFPDNQFTLVDSIGKKIKVVKEISKEINCNNIKAIHVRAENLNSSFNYVVSRAVTNMPAFISLVRPLITQGKTGEIRNGIIALKGGDLDDELQNIAQKVTIVPISNYFEEDFFATKKIVYLPM